MRSRFLACVVLIMALAVPPPTRAVPPNQWGSRLQRLQKLVDARYGRGHIDVTRDFLGARAGDPDPWFWSAQASWVFKIKDLTVGPHRPLGWYAENGVRPVWPCGGLLFDGRQQAEDTRLVSFGRPTRFGFYLDCGGTPGASPHELRFTNRFLNGTGPDGRSGLHEPFEGAVQALVFDVSPWSTTTTWLVCFEDEHTGGEPPGAPRAEGREADVDFDDLVIEVARSGLTAAQPPSFGDVKARYRR